MIDIDDGNFKLKDVPNQYTFTSSERHSAVTAEEISERFQISLKQARDTLKGTTQRGVRSAVLPMFRRMRTDRFYQHTKLRGTFGCDEMHGRTTSLSGNNYCMVYADKKMFIDCYSMHTKNGTDTGNSLKAFGHDWGYPEELVYDGAKALTGAGTLFQQTIAKEGIKKRMIEHGCSWQNPAEQAIGRLRKRMYRAKQAKSVPDGLWDYNAKYQAEIMRVTSNSHFGLNGRSSQEATTGDISDISHLTDFTFYDWVYYKQEAGLGDISIGKWLGPANRAGASMSYWILNENGYEEVRSTVGRIPNLDMQKPEIKARLEKIDEKIKKVVESKVRLNPGLIQTTMPQDWAMQTLEYDEAYELEAEKAMVDTTIPEADDINPEYTPDLPGDPYLNVELAFPHSEEPAYRYGKVIKRQKNEAGEPVGTANDNPLMDTRQYVVQFPDEHEETLSANIIAECMFSQVDEEGNRHVLFDEISEHRKTALAIPIDDAFQTMSNGRKVRRKTTVGWDVLINWKDGSQQWIALKDVKNAYPVQLAEYAVANRISEEPAFAWWVPHTLKKRNRIISKVKASYWLKTHKFGIEVPKSVEHAKKLDAANGDTLWWDAICQEMRNVRIAFEEWDKEEKDIPPGYQKINCHMIFDIKMGENFRRKARFVAGGHTTDCPPEITYSSMVSRDSVRIVFTLAALNGLDIKGADIQNAYLTAQCREKIYTICGPEFGSDKGKIMIIKRALYGLKSAGGAFWALLRETLSTLGFTPSQADRDVWMRPAVKADGSEYYEYILAYVDDIACASMNPKAVLQEIEKKFKLKNDKIADLDTFLGARISKRNVDGIDMWMIGSQDYVDQAVKSVEAKLEKEGRKLPTRCTTPFPCGYRPEIDSTPELNAAEAAYYQELVGVVRWGVELGRIDINFECSVLSSHTALPREGHMDVILHLFGYLKVGGKWSIMMDPREPKIDESLFADFDWLEFYDDAKEKLPGNPPLPRGKSVTTTTYVDADHAANRLTRRSHTGIILFLNRAPVIWYSKRQNTVESSSFGSEMIAARIAVDMTEALRYKLRMFGVPLGGPTTVFGDNEAVTKGARVPQTKLNKKHNSIAFHRVRESVAQGMTRFVWTSGDSNLADLLTKSLNGPRRARLMGDFMY